MENEVILDMFRTKAKPCKCGAEPVVSMVADPEVGEMYRLECLRCGEPTERGWIAES